jgi:hypothetical protein
VDRNGPIQCRGEILKNHEGHEGHEEKLLDLSFVFFVTFVVIVTPGPLRGSRDAGTATRIPAYTWRQIVGRVPRQRSRRLRQGEREQLRDGAPPA